MLRHLLGLGMPDSGSYVKHDARSERALLIGDSPQDIRAGQAAGVYTCAVTYGFRPIEELRPLQPDLVIDHPMALKEHIA